jgi:hypothetical protein
MICAGSDDILRRPTVMQCDIVRLIVAMVILARTRPILFGRLPHETQLCRLMKPEILVEILRHLQQRLRWRPIADKLNIKIGFQHHL